MAEKAAESAKRVVLEGLRILVQVDPGKRQEFIQSAQDLLPESCDRGKRCQRLLLQSVENEDLFCLVVEFEENRDLVVYMRSDRYRALLGAVKILGMPDNLNITEYQPLGLDPRFTPDS